MDYSSAFFGKPLTALTYQDIVNYFIDAKEESNTIEFKSFNVKHGDLTKNLEGIIRSISAFLNSEGGLIIWGAPEGIKPQGQANKIFQGNLSPLSESKPKDWLINKISDSITPLPVGINIQPLQNGKDILYIFEVQKSNYSPLAVARVSRVTNIL